MNINQNRGIGSQKSSKAKKKSKVGKSMMLDNDAEMETLKEALGELEKELKESF